MDNRITREEFEEYNRIVLQKTTLDMSETVCLGLFISFIILWTSFIIYWRCFA